MYEDDLYNILLSYKDVSKTTFTFLAVVRPFSKTFHAIYII